MQVVDGSEAAFQRFDKRRYAGRATSHNCELLYDQAGVNRMDYIADFHLLLSGCIHSVPTPALTDILRSTRISSLDIGYA